MGKSTKPINPAKRKKIIADYAECRNYAEVARNHNISWSGVKKIVSREPEAKKLCEQKADEHVRDALESLDSRSKRMVALVDKLLDAMDAKAANPDMFTNIKDLATAFGIVVDKMTKAREMQQAETKGANNGILPAIIEAVKDID